MFCLGAYPPDQLEATFKGSRARLFVHDRDKRAPSPEPAPHAEEGGEAADYEEGGGGRNAETGEAAPVWSGLRRIDLERWQTPRQPDPVGTAVLDLSDIITRQYTQVEGGWR